jgi:hypothetical protein
VNGDGYSNTILDAELQSAILLSQQIVARGLGPKTRISIVTFSGVATRVDMNRVAAGTQYFAYANADANANSTLDVVEILKTIRAGGATNYEAALQAVISTFTDLGTASGNGNLIFLSDGVPTAGGSFDDEVATLAAANVNRRAFGVGSAALDQLQRIDPFASLYQSGVDLFAAINLNNSTRYAGEPGQAGVRVYLDLNDDGIYQSATEPSTLTLFDDPDTASVDEGGTFRFSNLAAGSYVVREVVPAGYYQTKPGSGGSFKYTVNVVGGKTNALIDFGNASNPTLSVVPASLSYKRQTTATQLAPSIVVNDLDTPKLAGGQLIVRVASNADPYDTLMILAQGTSAGQIGVSGSNITYGGVLIGTFSGGTGSTALTVNLNASASLAAVQALARRIAFRNSVAAASTATRTIQWKITDGQGGSSAVASETVTVT